jgi:hypothetical protein
MSTSYVGDYRLGNTVYLPFATTDTSGVPTQLAGSPAVMAWPSANLTQLSAGITLTTDYDGITGLNYVAVVASSGNGYTVASDYDLILSAGTVGGASVVGYPVGKFSIENRAGIASLVWDEPQTGHVTLGKAGTQLWPLLNTIDTNTAELDAWWADGGRLDLLIDALLLAVGAGFSIPTAERNAIADALLDRTAGIETGLTPRNALRLIAAATAGKLSGAGTATEVMRNAVADTKDRITATVSEAGNRTAIVTDLT